MWNRIRWVLVGIAAFGLAILGYALGRRGRNLRARVENEIDVIDAKADAKRKISEAGLEVAKRETEKRYRSELLRLDEKQRAEADRLRSDPVALSAFLTRLSGE